MQAQCFSPTLGFTIQRDTLIFKIELRSMHVYFCLYESEFCMCADRKHHPKTLWPKVRKATKPLRDVILLLALRAQGSPFYSVPSEKLSKNYSMYSESIQGSAKRVALIPLLGSLWPRARGASSRNLGPTF